MNATPSFVNYYGEARLESSGGKAACNGTSKAVEVCGTDEAHGLYTMRLS